MVRVEGKPNIENIKRVALQILKEIQEKENGNGFVR